MSSREIVPCCNCGKFVNRIKRDPKKTKNGKTKGRPRTDGYHSCTLTSKVRIVEATEDGLCKRCGYHVQYRMRSEVGMRTDSFAKGLQSDETGSSPYEPQYYSLESSIVSEFTGEKPQPWKR